MSNNEQRIQTIVLAVDSGQAELSITKFSRAIKGTDAFVKDLNDTMGKNATVTAKTILVQKEADRAAKAQYRETKKLVDTHKRLTDGLKQEMRQINMSDDAQERFAAQMRLGEGATFKQRMELARLTKGLQLQRAASQKASKQNMQLAKTTTVAAKSQRNLRGQAQNLGWQVQDVAVQMQMGTDAMVIFSQQGSQLASGFGPGGAIIGAFIAIGGALAGVAIKMLTGKKTTKELEEAQVALNLVFDDGAKSADELGEAYRKLFIKNKDLALLTARVAQFAAKDQMKAARTEIAELNNEYFKLTANIKANGDVEKAQQDAINLTNKLRGEARAKQAKELGLSITQYKEINALVSSGAHDAASQMIVDIATSTGIANRELADLAVKYATADQKVADSAERIEKLRKIMQGEIIPEPPKEDPVKKVKAEKAIKDTGFSDIAREVQKEIDLRNKALGDIYASQQNFINKHEDPRIVEEKRYIAVLKTLNNEKAKLWAQDELSKKAINTIVEQEEKRHDLAMIEAQTTVVANNLKFFEQANNIMQQTVDSLFNGSEQIKEQTADMNAFQKMMFLSSQALMATTALINGISLGGKLAEMFPGASIQMQAFGTAMGAANAGAIMGATFAGTFDKGGYIPPGQNGIVSEVSDELVNGVMVKGPARVTSSADTAKMVGGKTQLNVSVHNEPGVSTRVERLGENDIKLIAFQVFNDNIDNGVSGVLNQNNSKSIKALKRNTNTRSRY